MPNGAPNTAVTVVPTYGTEGQGPPELEKPQRPTSPVEFRVAHDYPIQLWTSWDVPTMQSALDAHVQGNFYQSGLLAEAMTSDDAVDAVMNTRTLGLLSRPIRFTPSKRGNKTKARVACREIQDRWDTICPEQTISALMRGGNHMGFQGAQLIWKYDDALWTPRIQTWHASLVYYRLDTRTYVANTLEGPQHVLPGTGQWLLYAPYGDYRGWVQGAIRALAVPWIARQYALRDWARYSEVHGIAIKKAKVPANALGPDKDAFTAAIAALGNETTVMLPQGVGPEQGYDLDLLEAKADTWEAFAELITKCETRIAIRYLGQNLTTDVDAGSLAAANVHDRVRLDYTRADSKTLGLCLKRDVLAPFCAFNFGDPDLAPEVEWVVKPPEDQATRARAISEISVAAQNFANAQAPVDQRKLLEQTGIPTLPEGEEPPPPPDPGDEPQQAPRGPGQSTSRATLATREHALAGQLYADGVADTAAAQSVRAMNKHLKTTLASLRGAKSYEELRRRLKAQMKGKNRKDLQRLLEQVLVMGELAGRHAVNQER